MTQQSWIAILVIGGIALVLVIWRSIQFFEQYKILKNGVHVWGRIIAHRKELGRGSYSAYVTISYEYEGKTYIQEQQVSMKFYLTYPDQTKVNVHFMPEDPTRVVMKID